MSSASLTSSLAWRIVVLLEPDLLERRERATPVLMPGKGEWWPAQGECWNAGLRCLATRDAPFELGRFRLNGFNLERDSTG